MNMVKKSGAPEKKQKQNKQKASFNPYAQRFQNLSLLFEKANINIILF